MASVPARRGARLSAICALVALPLIAAVAFTQTANDRRPIVDFIAELGSRGITVIYGSDLLPDSLTMGTPGSDRGLASLEAALRPHGLTLRPGPRNTWLVVSAVQQEVDSQAAASAQPARRPSFGPPILESVVVSASRYAYSRSPAPSGTRLDHTQLVYAPTFGSDAIRATHGLPGLTSSGLTAQVNVRGGDSDESLLFVDGVRLYNPFHLKDFQSLFSSISPALIDSMAVYTGAYPAQYGDRMSAVIDIETVLPERDRMLEVGVSTLTTSILSSGRFADRRGGWLASARRGNLDLLFDAAKTDLGSPRYIDEFGKVYYELTPELTVTGGFLALQDRISLIDGDIATAHNDYTDTYLWSGFEYNAERLGIDAMVTTTELSAMRTGQVDDPLGSLGSLKDVKEFESASLQFNWSYAFNESNLLRGGIEIRDEDGFYDFQSQRTDRAPIALSGLSHPPAVIDEIVALSGRHDSFFLSYRARPIELVTAEVGVRWDEQSLPADSQLSPRFSLRVDVSDRLNVRGSWGRYYQADGLDELQIGDGVTALYPVQQSEHLVLGAEYILGPSISMRFEAYRKEFERPRPRFENLFDKISLLPELQPDRVMVASLGGEATGFEFSIEGGEGAWLWQANLTRSRTNDILAGGNVGRSWEEPWALKGGFLWQGPVWTVSLASTIHTGWPITGLTLVNGGLVAGPFNSNRLEHYSSLDIRASRKVLVSHGEFEWFAGLTNALNSKNPCCLQYEVAFDAQSQPVSLNVATDTWLPVLPSIGFLWRTGRDRD